MKGIKTPFPWERVGERPKPYVYKNKMNALEELFVSCFPFSSSFYYTFAFSTFLEKHLLFEIFKKEFVYLQKNN